MSLYHNGLGSRETDANPYTDPDWERLTNVANGLIGHPSIMDEPGVTELYAHVAPLIRFVVGDLKGVRPPDLDEIEQDASVGIIENIAKRTDPFINFATYVYQTGINQAAGYYRSRSRQQLVEDPATMTDPDRLRRRGVEASMEERTIARVDIEQALVQLPVWYRDVLVRRDVEGMSYEAIAAELDIELNTVRSRLSRARSHLGEALNGDES